jgi:hypothetical protein
MPTITNADALLIAAKDMSTALEGGVTRSETQDIVGCALLSEHQLSIVQMFISNQNQRKQ